MRPKRYILPTIIFLAIVMVALAVRLWPRTVPFDQCSDLYKQYANVDGVDATFIKDYKVNDTVLVDVTLLEATTDSGWAVLVRDFEMDELSPLLQMLIDRGENLVFSKLIPKSRPSDSAPNDVLAYSYTTRTVSIFHIANDSEEHAVLFHNLDKSTNKDN